MAQSAIIVSPVGRFVYGSLTETRKVDFENRAIPVDKQQYEFGVAFRKDDPQIQATLQSIAAHAWQEFAQYPHIQQIIGTYDFEGRGFSWKIGDGDKQDRQGRVNDNTKGHWVFYFKSAFAIKCADQKNAEIAAETIKRGFFVQVAFTVAGNGETGDRAGVFINPQIVRLVAYGQEILGGVSAEEAFAGHDLPQQLPPGASLTPVASGPMAVGNQAHGHGAPGQPHTPPVSQPGTNTMPPNTGSMTGYPGSAPQQPGMPPASQPVHPTFADGVPQQPGMPAAAPQQPGMPAAAPQQPGMPPVNTR